MEWNQNKIREIKAPTGAIVGSKVVFTRKGKLIEGLVIAIREQSVIVELSQKDYEHLELSNDRTVVNHSNYELVG